MIWNNLSASCSPSYTGVVNFAQGKQRAGTYRSAFNIPLRAESLDHNWQALHFANPSIKGNGSSITAVARGRIHRVADFVASATMNGITKGAMWVQERVQYHSVTRGPRLQWSKGRGQGSSYGISKAPFAPWPIGDRPWEAQEPVLVEKGPYTCRYLANDSAIILLLRRTVRVRHYFLVPCGWSQGAASIRVCGCGGGGEGAP